MNTISKIILLAGLAVLPHPVLATPMFEATPGMQFELLTEYGGSAPSSVNISSGGLFGSIDVGFEGMTGTDSDSFYDRVSVQITNTSSEDHTYLMHWEYWINGTADADPLQGETLTYSWDVGFIGLFPEEFGESVFESQSHVCSLTEKTEDWSCQAYYDYNEGDEGFFIAAGESRSFEMLIDIRAFAAVGVPEAPSLPVVAAGFLCLVCLQLLRRRKAKTQHRL